jgi:hypothetical protein
VKMAERHSKVDRSIYAPPPRALDWLSLLPDALAARDLRELVARVVAYRRAGRPVIWMMGAHPLKLGLGPLICGLIRHGWIQHVAVNGAAIVHDVELTKYGHTSEDVEEALLDGSYGSTEEVTRWINDTVYGNVLHGCGLGESIGMGLALEPELPLHESLFATAVGENLPITVHVGIGTDIYHACASACGATLGEASLADFQQFVETLRQAEGRAVLLNWGSAVLLPEVALKAFGVLRRHGVDLSGLLAANFDMLSMYRPRTQLVERVRRMGGTACDFRGHHELMMPLFASALSHALLNP